MSAEIKQAFILAAGFGGRLGPWAKENPKALLKINGQPLLLQQIERLRDSGVQKIVINVFHCADQIIKAVASAQYYGVEVIYSDERPHGPYGVLNGIREGLAYLDGAPFWLLSVDAWSKQKLVAPKSRSMAHLYCKAVTDKPDFYMHEDKLHFDSEVIGKMACYAGYGVFHPDFFAKLPGADNFAAQLRAQSKSSQLTAAWVDDDWVNVNTMQDCSRAQQ